MVFGAYSKYYNLIYKDKDYVGEAEYIHGLISKYNPGARSILDLGCGTGKHDLLLSEMGYEVTGIDLSEEMLAVAKAHPRPDTVSSLNFMQSDIRTVRLHKTYDVLVSLFHVMSYHLTNDDLSAVFATVRAHLKPGGIFIFDCWYGPAVLCDPPAVRVKRLEDEDISVVRIAEPVMQYNQNIVDVNYQIMVTEKTSGRVESLLETHRMRYLFLSEIDFLTKYSGMDMLFACEWMTGRAPGVDTWGLCVGLSIK